MRAKTAKQIAAGEWQSRSQASNQPPQGGSEDWDQWITHHWSIRGVLERGLESVLEIGVSGKVVSTVLRDAQVRLTTFDSDANREPDYVGSVNDMPFPENAFDGILCTEVLHLMPWEQTQQAIRELHRVSRRFVFVTVPHFTLSWNVLFAVPLLRKLELRLRLPFPLPNRVKNGRYWECGRLGYPVSKLRKEFEKAGFLIVSEKRPQTQYASCFFVLQKKGRI
jgi:hypothetical protein